jgi:putative nucleotidyltransferase with HDIG domain
LHELIERHLDEDLELPLLPEAAARVVALCDDEKADARALEGVLERDPSLAAHVLRLANSSAFAAREPIVSLQQAASRLGMSALRNIVLAVSLKGRVFAVPGQEARVRAIWAHCVVAAAYARELARRLRKNVEGAFLCGLLHDVGRPIVLQATQRTLAHRTREPLPDALLEAAMDEFHEQVSGSMVTAWQLAEWTASVVTHHHAPEKAAPYEEEARITRLADILANWAATPGSSAADFDATDPVIQMLNLYPEDVDQLLALRERMLASAEAFR